MTNPIVLSISDEQLAELEQAAIEIKGWNLVDAFRYADPCIEDAEDEEWCVGSIDEDGNQYPVMEVNAHQYDSQDSELLAHYYGLCNRESILGLIARLRAAEADAKRYRWLRDSGRLLGDSMDSHADNFCVVTADGEDVMWFEQLDSAIDAAMERTP
ncbi:hypothetical protein ACOANU_29185 [Pseudomonas aeruginosa]|uniref:hypothetical protein n=1 Tax=Pseudomonas aeruginosa TaxID=287 RepID=UPI0009378499|nr:hypothetical protein [Pseudomonas aeruginosa]ELK7310583.1 hypothetical protein [Pseudomonas aeruginosa]MCV6582181.1 hypothetical protein [Pseudomonas aeruginosa]MEA8655792.1 hypothetical protein [Pseudomonas aeruginosa]HCF3915087.1 hypothetical protein [Pseudomonas aeruginosa]HCR1538703.1 hypothetical protein [Pseudomonas aeruginosa]